MNLIYLAVIGIIALPLTHSAVGRGNPFIQGEKSPLPLVAFLYASYCTDCIRVISIMACFFGQRLALAAPCSGFPPQLSTPPDTVESIERRLSTFTRNTAMKTQSTQANSAQNPTKTALFSITWHRQTVCQNVTGKLALRFKRKHPECIVKFTGFEGGAA